ncbi:Hypothetical protein B839_12070 [Vibrio cholerae O1 str. Inaba G4222]|nr:Hypothetical protein B839_12070 [Vibrio cholerae O1 str. Inaba G4222]
MHVSKEFVRDVAVLRERWCAANMEKSTMQISFFTVNPLF